MILSFSGWAKFSAKKDKALIRRWMTSVAAESEKIFKAGMKGQHSGVIAYRKGGGRFQRSAPGEYPAVDSGALIASMKSQSTQDSATVGTNKFYAKFLREGTRKMARRKMSDNAIKAGGIEARPKSRGWIGWQKNQ